MPRPNAHHLWIRVLALVVMVLTTTSVIARPREERADGERKSHRQHAQEGDAGVLLKSFACHYLWTVSNAWIDSPDHGPLLADGEGDHAVKVWNPNGRGSTMCRPGQFLEADGAVKQLGQIDGWITSLAFSPDRRWLAGASRDRTVAASIR